MVLFLRRDCAEGVAPVVEAPRPPADAPSPPVVAPVPPVVVVVLVAVAVVEVVVAEPVAVVGGFRLPKRFEVEVGGAAAPALLVVAVPEFSIEDMGAPLEGAGAVAVVLRGANRLVVAGALVGCEAGG